MTELVHLYPTADASIPGELAEERDVTPAEAKRLLAYHPPAYTTSPPGKPAKQPEAAPKGAVSDSEEIA